MADPVEESLFREIDEDLRQEKYAKLWKQYGAYVIGAAVAIIVIVAGHQGWRSYDLSVREEATERLATSLELAASDPATAQQTLVPLIENGPDGIAMLARFLSAGLLGEQGDHPAAAAAYLELSEDLGIDPMYRDLAVIKGVQQALAKAEPSIDPQILLSRLEPITVGDNPWRFSARQLMGLIAMQTGDKTRAHEIFSSLAQDPDTPEGMREIANELLAMTDVN